jgi:hypothetical protein
MTSRKVESVSITANTSVIVTLTCGHTFTFTTLFWPVADYVLTPGAEVGCAVCDREAKEAAIASMRGLIEAITYDLRIAESYLMGDRDGYHTAPKIADSLRSYTKKFEELATLVEGA